MTNRLSSHIFEGLLIYANFVVMKQSWYQRKWVNVLLHATFWIVLFVVPNLLQPSFDHKGPRDSRPPDPADLALFNVLKCVLWTIIFYFTAYVLVPRLGTTKKYSLLIIFLLMMLTGLSIFELVYFQLAGRGARFNIRSFLLFNMFPFLFIVASAAAYRMFLDKTSDEKRKKEREAEHLKSELSFLRSQISPHFMFNVLNNIVALARKKSDLVEPSLIKLSSLMRYFLYERAEDKVPLEREIEYLQSYIDLQQQRFGKDTVVKFHSGKMEYGYEIEPMLLIPFVENAFKHGVVQEGSITVELSAEKGMLHFSVVNRYEENTMQVKDETSGIGLTNVKRRLKLLYDNQHVLLVSRRDGWYRVSLELKLH
jgi:two-component system LytT family sensor kinase